MKRITVWMGVCVFLLLLSGCEMVQRGSSYSFSESRSIIKSIEFGRIDIDDPTVFQAESEVPFLSLSSFLKAFQDIEFQELPGIYGTSTEAIRITYNGGNYEVLNGKLAVYGYIDENGNNCLMRKWLTCSDSELLDLIHEYSAPVEQGSFPFSESEQEITAVEIVNAEDEYSFEVISRVTGNELNAFLDSFRQIVFRKNTNPPFPEFGHEAVRIVYSSGNYEIVMNSVSVFVDLNQSEKSVGRIIDYQCDSDTLEELIKNYSGK